MVIMVKFLLLLKGLNCSSGLMTLINKIEDKICIPDLTICFDCYYTNYNTLYVTSSLKNFS